MEVKKKGIDILKKFGNCNRVIGIFDRDYDVDIKDEKIFFCDYCNVEMMILSDDRLFSDTLFNIFSSFIDVCNIRRIILDDLLILSAIRKLNYIEQWGLSFTNLPLKEIIKNKTDLEKIIFFINKKNVNNIIDISRKKFISLEVTAMQNLNLLNYTNGHDFCHTLLLELKELYKTNRTIQHMNLDELWLLIISGYGKEYFKKSKLYSNILSYQQNHGLKIVII